MDSNLYPRASAFEDCIDDEDSALDAATTVRRCWGNARKELTVMVGAMTVDLLLKRSLTIVGKIRAVVPDAVEFGEPGVIAFVDRLETFPAAAARATARLFLRSVHTSLTGMVGEALASRMLRQERAHHPKHLVDSPETDAYWHEPLVRLNH